MTVMAGFLLFFWGCRRPLSYNGRSSTAASRSRAPIREIASAGPEDRPPGPDWLAAPKQAGYTRERS